MGGLGGVKCFISSSFSGEPSLERENSTVSSQVSVEQEQAEAPEAGSTKKPVIVPLPDDLTAMQVDCGTFHTGRWTLVQFFSPLFNFFLW